MLANRSSGSINSDGNGKGLNELEETVGSSRSSFADIWDSTSIEVREKSVLMKIYLPLRALEEQTVCNAIICSGDIVVHRVRTRRLMKPYVKEAFCL